MTNHHELNRRTFMKMAGASLAAGAVLPQAGCTTLPAQSGQRADSKPNILYIIADDLGWADVSYQGSRIHTPNIDALAKNGVALNQHYVMPTCTPTRVGLMTGQYPSRYGVLAPAYGQIFDPDTVTLAEALRRKGYSTAISGKWHMGSPPECVPTKFGFQSSYGYFAGQIDPYTHLYKTGTKTWHRNDELFEEAGHATDLITDEAVRIIRGRHGKPFFLYVAYSVPHYPLHEPDEWLDMYKDIESESRRWYAASVTHMDAGIGKIVQAVDNAGLRGNTLIVFVSDNGAQKSWHSETQYKGRYANKPHTVLGDNRPLRGWKGDVFEGGIRVPGLVNWPKRLKPGKTDAPIHIVDWMPTLCALAGVEMDKDPAWDGVNVWPAITGESKTLAKRTLYWKTPG
ncbi:MAG: arylsulfatase, partial [Planctomycetes bacterium]|nr:arylsulfatase [Planctomycetota bacterium]